MGDVPEMVEKVAKVLVESAGEPRAFWWAYEDRARAVIEAMRDPTEGVLGALHDRVRIQCRPEERAAYITNADEMWNAAIDAALASQGNGRET